MQLTFRVNLSRVLADRVNGANVVTAINTQLRTCNVTVTNPPRCQNNALADSILPLESRSVVCVGLGLQEEQLTPQVMHAVTAACINAILYSAGQFPMAPQAIGVLPPLGSGRGDVSIIGPVRGITRVVAPGQGWPSLAPDNALYQSTVVSTTSPDAHIGDVTPSGLGNAAHDLSTGAAGLWETYKTPIYIGGAVVSLVAVAVIVKEL